MADLRFLHVVQPYGGGSVSNVVANLMREFRNLGVRQ